MDSSAKESVVSLKYYKDNGTFYAEGKYVTNKQTMFDICDEIRSMNSNCKLPGVTSKYKYIHISCDSDFSYPCLVISP